MNNVITEILVNIAILFCTGVIIVVGNALRKWLESKITESEGKEKATIYYMLYDIVQYVVNGIEQIYLSGADMTSKQKKRKAVEEVKNWVNQNGYGQYISEELIGSVIESAVKTMNTESGEHEFNP